MAIATALARLLSNLPKLGLFVESSPAVHRFAIFFDSTLTKLLKSRPQLSG
jgi:hypothetical protein